MFATWSSMHEPIESFVSVPDEEVANKLIAKWIKAKLEELQYVGSSVRA